MFENELALPSLHNGLHGTFHGQHHPWLVVLSVVIAIFTSGMALHLAAEARNARSRFNRHLAIATGALSLGGGVWAMHFIGMLALQLPIQVSYDPLVTLFSVVPGVLASWVALVLLARARLNRTQYLVGGVLVGGGIGSMHYSGMAALLGVDMLFNPPMLVLSVLVAVGLSMVALWARFGLRCKVCEGFPVVSGSVVMGVAVSAMHYTGMAAVGFIPSPEAVEHGILGSNSLVLGITLGTLGLSVLVAVVNGLLRYRDLLAEVGEGRSHLDAMLDAAFEMVLTIDHQGVIRSVNKASTRVLGWTPESLLGQPMTVLITAEDGERFQSALKRYRRTGKSQLAGTELEVKGLAQDGRVLPLRASIGITERHGQPWFVVFMASIGERKAMEAALRASEQQYRSLIRNIPGVSFRCLLDHDWTMLFISDAVEELTGWPAIDFVERRKAIGDMYHPDDYQRVADQVMSAIDAGQKYTVEYRLIDRHGREHWIWESGSAVYDDAGKPTWIDGVLLDQTETKLRNSEYEGKVNAIGRAMALIEFDMQGRILDANDNFCTLFGYSREELVGQDHSLFCSPSFVSSDNYRQFWDGLRSGTFRSGECQRYARDGHEVWLQATYNPILDFDGHPFKVVKLATDLTPRRLMEQELRTARDRAEQAAAARSSFLANMSHEIRTPMNAIIGFTELLLGTALSEQQRRHLRTVQQSSRSLLRLLNDILDTAKLDRGAIELENLVFSLRELCEQVCDAHRLAAEKKGLRLVLAYDARLGDGFVGDPLRLRQVLTNLLGNAVKFTEAGEVKLEASGEPGALHLAVHDTGIGIPTDRIDRIFDPFAQADASMSRRFGGTGLGTTISRQLVELMGGRITARSEEGRGSVFQVNVPLPAAQLAPKTDRSANVTSLPPLDILIADDVAQNLELLQLNLAPLGHRVVAVADGAAAVAAYSCQHFDVVLMDVQMPGMDGLEASRQIREKERAGGRQAVPIIALTASVLDRDRQAALDAGMNGFASKPLEMPNLLAEMARLLGHQPTAVLDSLPAPPPDTHIDTARGEQLWGGRLPHGQAIRRFLAEQSGGDGAAVGLRQWAAAPLAEQLQTAHRLRGAAANLCLPRLTQLATDLETDLKCPPGPQATATQSAWLALDAECDALAALVGPGDAAAPAAAGGLDQPEALRLVQHLAQALERGGLDDQALQDLGTAMGADGQSRWTSVQQALDDFDFDLASRHLKALQAWLTDLGGDRA